MYIEMFNVNGILFFISKTVTLNFLSSTNLKSGSGREITNTTDKYKNMNNEASISREFMVTTNLTFSHSNISYYPSIYIYTLNMNVSDSLRIQSKQ